LAETTNLSEQLKELGGDVHASLEEVSVPMYVLDRKGRIRWLNDSARALLPEATGKNFTDVLAPDQIHPAKRHFALRMLNREAFDDHETVLRTSDGGRHGVEISSVPLRKGHRIVGVFGVMKSRRPAVDRHQEDAPAPALTARQHEVLRLLGAGLNTRQMADQMGLSTETVRNHVRAVLAGLGARSRLEAVLLAHRQGLLEWPGETAD